MDLFQGKLYWPETSRNSRRYDKLEGDLECDVLIIGGGLSGALCAFLLGEYGVDTVLIEKKKIGERVSAANTGSLHFMSDQMLTDLFKQIGDEKAVSFYKLSQKAIDELARIAADSGTESGFEKKSSLYFSSSNSDLSKLKAEYELLSKLDFPVAFMDKKEIESKFPFTKPGAIYTLCDARINPLKYCQAVTERAAGKGVKIFENTAMKDYELGDKKHTFKTNGGTISAQKVIFATGYDTLDFMNTKKITLSRTHAIVTNPLSDRERWYEDCLIWETKRPYLYISLSDEKRLIAGGLDETEPVGGYSRKEFKRKTEKLLDSVKELFPNLEAKVEFEYNSIDANTFDGLPLIGEHPKHKNVYFLLGFGGNGTVCSMIGAMIIRDLIKYNYHPAADIVRLDRS
jgi:glycine/D-amino acid oxidase-like deaminating enzyme